MEQGYVETTKQIKENMLVLIERNFLDSILHFTKKDNINECTVIIEDMDLTKDIENEIYLCYLEFLNLAEMNTKIFDNLVEILNRFSISCAKKFIKKNLT